MGNKKPFFNIAQKSLQKILVMQATRDDFARDVKKIRQEHLKLRLLAKDKDDRMSNLLESGEKIEKLRIKYKLSSPHFIPLSWLVLFDDKKQPEIDKMYNKDSFKIISDKFGDRTIYIPVYPETTINDIRDILPNIKKKYKDFYGGPVLKRVRRINRVNLTIAEMKREGYSNNDIKAKVDKSLFDIPIIVNRLKKYGKIK